MEQADRCRWQAVVAAVVEFVLAGAVPLSVHGQSQLVRDINAAAVVGGFDAAPSPTV